MGLALTVNDIIGCGIQEADAKKIHAQFLQIQTHEKTPEKIWHATRQQILLPTQPFKLHELLRTIAFANWDEATQGPHPLWRATPERLAKTNIAQILKEKNIADYSAFYNWSIQEGRAFWDLMCKRLGIQFENDAKLTAESIVDTGNPHTASWFPGMQLNIANSCFQADPASAAIIYQREGSAELKSITYGELNAFSNRVANALKKEGFQPKDRIAIDMPFNVESVAVFLGIIKLGATVVSLADSFKKMDIDMRLEAAHPVKAIFTQDVTGGLKTYPLYPSVIEASLAPRAIVVSAEKNFVPLREGDISFDAFIADASDEFTAVPMDGEAYINIIFSSSTSSPKEGGDEKPKPPKAIPWQPATAIKSATDAHLHHDMQPGKVLCWPTNLGWMMGSFAIFGAFLNQGTLAMFDGSPTSKDFAKFLVSAQVNILGLVPSIAETWQKQGTLEGVDLSDIEIFSSTGSPSNKSNYFWLMSRVKNYAPCFEYMGGTEIGGGYLISSYFQSASPSCFTTPALGTDIYLWPKDDENGRAGEVFIVMHHEKNQCPPMGLSTVLLNFDHDEKYFIRGLKAADGCPLREHGDIVIRLPGGFFASNGRADDGININGIKTSSLDLENYIKDAHIPHLKEVAAIGVRPPQGGEDWLVIYMTADGAQAAESFKSPIREAIKKHNPQLARVHDVVIIPTLPLTASGKLRRRYLQDLYLENLGDGVKAAQA